MQTVLFYKAGEWIEKYRKPLIYDECCYEGNLRHSWGNISAEEMVHRFWSAYCSGAFATHGETYLSEDDVLWWSKGGKLKGKSSEGIAFLREVLESLPGSLEPWQEPFLMPEDQGENDNLFLRLAESMTEQERDALKLKDGLACGHVEEQIYIKYYGLQCPAESSILLPENHTYRIELIDTREKTRKIIAEHQSGLTWMKLPGKEKMAVLAITEGN